MLIAFNKPWGVLSQFTQEEPGQRTLAEFGFPRDISPIGRLDRDSEGLLLLSDEKPLVDRLLNPRQAHPRTYCVQVEGIPETEALAALAAGVMVQGVRTLPCRVRRLDPAPVFPPRDPPVRVRQTVPDCWIEITLTEGRNRQVRRMTAATGHPTLRLLRTRIGAFSPADIAPGKWRALTAAERALVLGRP
jgi:23S rRNA pseudouridine2457 synthase